MNFIILITFIFIIIVFNPLVFSILLVIFSLVISINLINLISFINFSYLLCLVYVGGIIILFVYISSFIPNLNFYLISKKELVVILFYIVFPFYFTINNVNFTSVYTNNLLFINYTVLIIIVLSFYFLILVNLISLNNIPLRTL